VRRGRIGTDLTHGGLEYAQPTKRRTSPVASKAFDFASGNLAKLVRAPLYASGALASKVVPRSQ
jgi:hypothetical protein